MEFKFIDASLGSSSRDRTDREGREWYDLGQRRVILAPKTVQDGDTMRKILSMLENYLAHISHETRERWHKDSAGAHLGTVGLSAGHNPITGELHFVIRKVRNSDFVSQINHLETVLGKDNMAFNIYIKCFVKHVEFINAEEEVTLTKYSVLASAEDKESNLFMFARKVSPEIIQKWSESVKHIEGRVDVTLKIRDEAVSSILAPNLEWSSLDICRKMMQDSSSMDGLLVVEGAEVKCHRGVLNAHSPVLKAMFESKMKEGLTNTIEIVDMTEQGVRALLTYLYCWEVTEASKSCEIALELLVAGDKYGIPSLRKSVMDLLICKDINWYTPSVIMQLLQFARKKIGGDEDTFYKKLEKLALTALKKIPHQELEDCLEFQTMFLDPKVGMAFSIYLFHSA